MTDDPTQRAHAAADAVGAGLAGIVGIVRDTQAAVVRRTQQHLPTTADAVSAAQGSITDGVYAVVSTAHRHLPGLVARAWTTLSPPDPAAPVPGWQRSAQATGNGLWGDRLERDHAGLAIEMAVRRDGADVPLTDEGLAAAFPSATGHVVLFVHGLVEDETCWQRPHESLEGGYGDRLRGSGLTPVDLRYNSGLRISENGRRLACLVDALAAHWPVPVESISFVGHSMGGLVARSAGHAAAESGSPWVDLVHAVVTLGTPHHGAPLEKAVHVLDWALRRHPDTEPLGRPLAARSAGIADLRFGAVLDSERSDPDRLLHDATSDVALLPHVTYYWVAASLTPDPDHPWGRLLGDGLVRYPSASGTGRRPRLDGDPANGLHVGGVGHLDLLNHPDVDERLREWLDPARRSPDRPGR
jgi:hypothetical protein